MPGCGADQSATRGSDHHEVTDLAVAWKPIAPIDAGHQERFHAMVVRAARGVHLLRSRAVRLRRPSAVERARPGLQRGRASLIPSRPGDRVKTNRRDATTLARLHRAGELTPVWVPDGAHEAMRDLVRARAAARRVLGKARQHLQGFLLRHGRIYRGVRGWTRAYRRWLTTVRFDHPAQQIVLQDYIHAVEDAEARLARLERQIEELLPA
jgi:hypothetical protein